MCSYELAGSSPVSRTKPSHLRWFFYCQNRRMGLKKSTGGLHTSGERKPAFALLICNAPVIRHFRRAFLSVLRQRPAFWQRGWSLWQKRCFWTNLKQRKVQATLSKRFLHAVASFFPIRRARAFPLFCMTHQTLERNLLI